MSNPRIRQQVPLDDFVKESRVTVRVGQELDGKILHTYQESVTKDGASVVATIKAILREDCGSVEVLIQGLEEPVTVRRVFAQEEVVFEHISNPPAYINNTSEQEGVKVMEPFPVFWKEARVALMGAAPTKLGAGGLLGLLATVLKWNPVDEFFVFSVLAVLDWLMVMMPNVHPTGQARSATTLSRFYQWCLALMFLGGGVTLQYFLKLSNPEAKGITKWTIAFLPHAMISVCIAIYVGRMSGALMRGFFGKRAPKVQKSWTKNLPGFLQGFFDTTNMD